MHWTLTNQIEKIQKKKNTKIRETDIEPLASKKKKTTLFC